MTMKSQGPQDEKYVVGPALSELKDAHIVDAVGFDDAIDQTYPSSVYTNSSVTHIDNANAMCIKKDGIDNLGTPQDEEKLIDIVQKNKNKVDYVPFNFSKKQAKKS